MGGNHVFIPQKYRPVNAVRLLDRAVLYAGSLVDSAGLHAHHAVLHNIHDSDAVLAAQLVQGGITSETFMDLPFTEVGTPSSIVMVTYSPSCGAFSGRTLIIS